MKVKHPRGLTTRQGMKYCDIYFTFSEEINVTYKSLKMSFIYNIYEKASSRSVNQKSDLVWTKFGLERKHREKICNLFLSFHNTSDGFEDIQDFSFFEISMHMRGKSVFSSH